MKMAYCSNFSTTTSFLLFCLVSFRNFSSTNALYTDTISTTCKQCASRSAVFNYTFCLASLETVPTAASANLQELAVIAMKLARENASSTISTIKEMTSCDKFDPFAKACLRDCLELYENGLSTLADSVAALFNEQYGTANSLISAVMEVSVTCEDGFKEKGEVPPLSKENYNLFELTDIALCIINLLSFRSTLSSSI